MKIIEALDGVKRPWFETWEKRAIAWFIVIALIAATQWSLGRDISRAHDRIEELEELVEVHQDLLLKQGDFNGEVTRILSDE